MIEYFVKNQKKIEKKTKFEKGCWVNITNPSQAEQNFLLEEFNLDKNNLINGLDIYENPRIEIKKKKIYIYLTAPTEKIKHEYDSSFLVILSTDSIFTISKYNLEILNKILNQEKKTTKFSNTTNLLRILFYLSRSFETSVHKIMKEIKLNKADLNKLKNKDVAKLIDNEDKLNNYISSFVLTTQIYKKLLKEKSINLTKTNQEVIENLIIDLSETLTLSKQTLKTISTMREYYSTKLSNDLNKTITLLTVFTIFLSIPTLIASVYGMNISLPFQSSTKILSFLGFFTLGIWFLMIFILKYFKRI